MAPTFASALTLSAVALGSRAFTRLGTKRFDVQGLPILLDALKEPASRKGKERERIVLGENGEEMRRGIVTGERRAHFVLGLLRCSITDRPALFWSSEGVPRTHLLTQQRSLQPQLGGGRSNGTSSTDSSETTPP